MIDIEKLAINEDIINPWNVQGTNNDGINYDQVVEKFKVEKLSEDLVKKFEEVIGRDVHYLIKRGFLISHRNFEQILDLHANKKPFYLYCGISPAETVHLGHLTQFNILKWLQDVFNVPVIIQLTDDEAVLWKDLKVENVNKLVKETAKEIIAMGFDASKTFIFSSFTYMGQSQEYYRNIIRVRKSVTYGTIKNTFGFTDSDPIGKIVFPSIQLIPTLSNTFPDIFGTEKVQPLVFCGIDQEPYFRLMQDISPLLGFPQPAVLHTMFIPALQGVSTKMSSSDANTAILLTDTAKQIKTKVNKHAFSGGKVTVEEHREFGGDTNVDVAYHILKYFLPNDEDLEKVRLAYSSGQMLTGEIKKLAIECLQEIISAHQEKKKVVTDAIIEQFMTPRKLNV